MKSLLLKVRNRFCQVIASRSFLSDSRDFSSSVCARRLQRLRLFVKGAVVPLLSSNRACAVAVLLQVIQFSTSLLISQAERYLLRVEEEGTRFDEEIDIDAKKEVETFKVPRHNKVVGADFMNDFKIVSFELFY